MHAYTMLAILGACNDQCSHRERVISPSGVPSPHKELLLGAWVRERETARCCKRSTLAISVHQAYILTMLAVSLLSTFMAWAIYKQSRILMDDSKAAEDWAERWRTSHSLT